jgi:hypothetical protein
MTSPMSQIIQLVAQARANRVLREAQKTNRPSVVTAGPANTPETPVIKETRSATKA